MNQSDRLSLLSLDFMARDQWVTTHYSVLSAIPGVGTRHYGKTEQDISPLLQSGWAQRTVSLPIGNDQSTGRVMEMNCCSKRQEIHALVSILSKKRQETDECGNLWFQWQESVRILWQWLVFFVKQETEGTVTSSCGRKTTVGEYWLSCVREIKGLRKVNEVLNSYWKEPEREKTP